MITPHTSTTVPETSGISGAEEETSTAPRMRMKAHIPSRIITPMNALRLIPFLDLPTNAAMVIAMRKTWKTMPKTLDSDVGVCDVRVV